MYIYIYIDTYIYIYICIYTALGHFLTTICLTVARENICYLCLHITSVNGTDFGTDVGTKFGTEQNGTESVR